MLDMTRLEDQESSFGWIDVWTIEQEVLGRTHEWNVGLDIVEDCLVRCRSVVFGIE